MTSMNEILIEEISLGLILPLVRNISSFGLVHKIKGFENKIIFLKIIISLLSFINEERDI